MNLITIIYPLRNQEAQRIYNCLFSLVRQSYKQFSIIISDYGSTPTFQKSLQKALSKINIKLNIQIIRTEEYGEWNRAKALNLGLKQVQTEYCFCSELDMIYAPNFLSSIVENLKENRYLIHSTPKQLTEIPAEEIEKKLKASEWDFFNSQGIQNINLKGCQVIQTKLLYMLGGYDEVYKHWGPEDEDLRLRLNRKGIEEFSLNDLTQLYQQFSLPKPIDFTTVLQNKVYFEKFQNDLSFSLIRNSGPWIN